MDWMNPRNRLATVGLATALLGCSCTIDSKSVGEDGGRSDDTAAATESMATSETGAPMCEAYESADDVGPSVEITVRSAAAQTFWFASDGGCGSAAPDYTITDAAGEGVRYWLSDCSQVFCGQIGQPGACAEGNCGGDCGVPQSGRMDAGATVETAWVGRRLTTLDVEPECAVDDTCPATCERVDQASPGTYEIAVTVYRSCTGECACDDEVAPCAVWGVHELGDPVTYTATVDYPSQTAVEIVVDDG